MNENLKKTNQCKEITFYFEHESVEDLLYEFVR